MGVKTTRAGLERPGPSINRRNHNNEKDTVAANAAPPEIMTLDEAATF